MFDALYRQKLKDSDAKSLLLLLAKKRETVEEIAGCVKALRVLEPPFEARIPNLIDTCGTGGDRSGSFNVSTLAAFVIAGAGGKVAKHGNRSISSRCGSSDFMEALGVNLNAGRKKMIRAIRRSGVGYFHAPFYHPVFSRLQPLRRGLKTRTIFNLLGPLVNPLRLRAQLAGVSKPKHVALFAEVLKKEMRRALVCHSRDGLDEISAGAPTDAAWIEKGRVRFFKIDPQRLGIPKSGKKHYLGGSPRENAARALRLLKGRLPGPLRDMVVLNSAAGLWVAGRAEDIRGGIRLAESSLASGKALKALRELKKISWS